jgi:PEP-CTERM motif
VLENLSHDLEMQSLNAPAFDPDVRDLTSAAGLYQAENMNSPGTWSPSAVPEPSSLLLVATGLLNLAGITWRNKWPA